MLSSNIHTSDNYSTPDNIDLDLSTNTMVCHLAMKRHYDRAILDSINWALDFGQEKLDKLRDGDILNLYEEGREFMGEGLESGFAEAFVRAVPSAKVKKALPSFQQKHDYVVSLAKGFERAVRWFRDGITFDRMAGEGYTILFTREPFRLMVEPAAIEHRAIIRLDYLIQSQGFPAEQIRPCSLCGRVFAVAMRLRKDVKNYYHSERCRQKAVARNRVR